MQNKLIDLNNHLFAELERLGEEELVGDKLNEEIDRAKAITCVANQIISNGNLVLKASMAAADSMNANFKIPKLLGE